MEINKSELASRVIDIQMGQIEKLKGHIHLQQKIYICEIVGEEIERIEDSISEILSGVTIH